MSQDYSKEVVLVLKSIIKFSDFVNNIYLEDKKKTWRNSTYKSRKAMYLIINKYIGEIRLIFLREKHILKMFEDMQLERNDTYLKLVNSVLNYAVKIKYLKKSPTKNIKVNRFKTTAEIFTKTELKQMLDYSLKEDPRVYIILLLAINTGARRGELCGITWDDIDVDESTVSINKQIVRDPGEIPKEIKTLKTAKSRRIIYIDKDILDIIVSFKNTEHTGSKYIIKGFKFEFACPDEAGRKIRWIQKSLNFKNYRRFHDLRHTHASMLIRSGVDIMTVSRRLGHADLQTTMTIYAHYVGGDKEASTVMNKMLKD